MMSDNTTFSDYLIFVDESGDHGLVSIDSDYPIFALAFVLIKKTDYLEKLVPSFQMLKMKYWGHDQIILHEHDIRKSKGPFGILRTDASLRQAFIDDLTHTIEQTPFQYIASIIDKKKLIKRYANPYNPYEISLLFCMEQLLDFLLDNQQADKTCHILMESRGSKENKQLELEFRRICDNQGSWGYKSKDFRKIPFEMMFTSKQSNASGLQLSDLIARPIALKLLRHHQPNRAYDVIASKCYANKWFP